MTKWRHPGSKLRELGAKALTDEELLAILISTGSAGKPAMDIAREVLDEFGSLKNITTLSAERLQRIKGLGEVKATQIIAMFEVARRSFNNSHLMDKEYISKRVNLDTFKRINRPRVISLFAGCGGLDLPFDQEGYKVVWANDNNEWAVRTFKRNFGNIIKKGDIDNFDPYDVEQIPDADLMLGGFPCQDFSIIWKRPGLNGDRGNLYKHFLRFVDAKKPLAFVAENVKGLLSANNRKAIEQIIRDFEDIAPGYIVKIKLLNFADYGVPQFRERVILVGIRMDTGFEFKFPKPTHGPKASKPYFTAGKALKGVEQVPYNNEHMNIAPRTIEILKLIPEGGNFSDIPKNHPLYVKGMISHVYRRIHRNEPAKTLIAAGGGGTWGYHYPQPRALTNRERARLQTFPDNFIFEGSFTEIRRQIGNAVPPEGVRHIARALRPLFLKEYVPVDLFELNAFYRKLSVRERCKLDTDQLA